MTTTTGKAFAAALISALALSAAGCATTTVARLMAEPNRYGNNDVRLKGDVTESVSLLGHGAYKLDDGTGTIWVVSRHGVPRKGARVEVKGEGPRRGGRQHDLQAARRRSAPAW